MADRDPLDPVPAQAGESAPATGLAPVPTPAPPARRDAHGFDPADFDWIPVPRRRSHADGWVPDKQRRFIAALADSGLVAEAARAVEMTVQSCYALRRAPGAAGFARAWDAAMEQAGRALLDRAFARVIEGEDIPILNRDGHRIGGKRRYSDKLMMFLLRGYFPERFGTLSERAQRTVTQPPAVAPVEMALAALAPVTPAEPHKLMPPGEFAEFLAAEAFNAAEEERFDREHPGLAARAAGDTATIRPVAAGVAPRPASHTWDDYTDFVAAEAAAAERSRASPRARRTKKPSSA